MLQRLTKAEARAAYNAGTPILLASHRKTRQQIESNPSHHAHSICQREYPLATFNDRVDDYKALQPHGDTLTHYWVAAN